MNASVDIIVPVYHGKKFINNCLDCIQAQTYSNYTVVVVLDDIMYDDTIDIIEHHKLFLDNKLVIVGQTGKSNPANARNRALEYCHGEYVCFLDVDDTWEPDKLNNQLIFMINTGIPVSFTSGWWHRDFGTFCLQSSDITINDHLSACMFIWSSVMFKRSVLDDVRKMRGYVFDESWPQCDDGELLLYIQSRWLSPWCGVVEYPLVHLYEHGENLTQGNLWAPNYWAAKTWWKYGYRWNATRHICMGILAVVSEWLHIRKYLRKWRMKFNGMVEV